MLKAIETEARFGEWTVMRFSHVHKSRPQYECRCVCGTSKIVDGYNLHYGTSTNCGCFKRKQWNEIVHRHGDAQPGRRAREYIAWCHMKSRCYNPKIERYPIYGGRGIRVCDRWLNSYENFIADMGRKPSPQHSIDRVDVNGDYSPENCRWATDHEQRMNRRPRS